MAAVRSFSLASAEGYN